MSHPRLSRRNVLKGAAAAVAAPLVIPSSALGNAEQPPPSERVGLGHIGVGGQGRGLLGRFMSCKGVQSLAVSDTYKSRREAVATTINGKAYADFRELLARPDIDAVVVATPDHWHVPIAIAAARAKKDAYVEKPLGLTIEQNLACRKVFQANARVFQYGTQQRSSNHCRFGCELVRSGKIGKVHTIEVIAPNGGAGGSTEEKPIPEDLDYDTWLGPAPKKPYTPDRCKPPGTYWIYDQSIGYLAGWGAHPLDIMVWGSDADLHGPVTVEGTGVVPDKGLYDTVYNWDCVIQTKDVKITFKPGGDSTKFIGPDGWVQVRRGGIDAEPKSLLQLQLGPNDVQLIKSSRHDQNFVDAVKSRQQPVSNLTDAVRSDNISQLCDIAVRLKRKITWDPKTEVIVGDDEAKKMCSRAMRAPWTL
jgi:predicted dehydrogenase